MTYDEVRDWLWSVRAMRHKKRNKKAEYDRIKADAEDIRALSARCYDEAGISMPTHENNSTTEKKALKSVNCLIQMDKIEEEICDLQTSIESVQETVKSIYDIGCISDSEYEVLCAFYFDAYSNREIKEKLGYSFTSIKNKKRNATTSIMICINNSSAMNESTYA